LSSRYKKFLNKHNLLVVCGPTASGKTNLGVKIADLLDGEIISADSRQVYRGMDLGTGKDLNEYILPDKKINHHLIDIVDPMQIYSLYNYVEDFYKAFEDITARRKYPVVVGGTGLYIEAVLKNYRIANVEENYDLRNLLMTQSKEELHERLKKEFPDIYAKTDCSSKKRVVRALEVGEYGKTHHVEWGGENAPELHPHVIAVFWERSELISRIDERLEARLKEGMVEEVEALLKAGVTHERMLLFGMEYKYITEYLLNKLEYSEMAEALKTSIHRLAKRQMTWFRGMQRRGTNIIWVEEADFNKVLGEINV
jgi:tRNA dimethylallyltransferase